MDQVPGELGKVAGAKDARLLKLLTEFKEREILGRLL
jgi:hypothetical protein